MTDLDEITSLPTAPAAGTPPFGELAVAADAELNLVAGEWRTPRGMRGEVQYNPSTGVTTGWLTYSSPADLDEAARAAAGAAPAWAALPRGERIEALRSLRAGISRERERLVALIAREVGKPLPQARHELDMASELLESIGDEDLWAGLSGSTGGESRRSLPVGVAGGISLYHYPLLSPLWMAVPALATGNAYVLRPCTWSPLTSRALGELIDEAGLPDGVFNMVQGSLQVVDAMLAHPAIEAISYVGSGPWAHYMYARGSKRGKRVQAVGAIRQIHVVLADADPARAARSVFDSAIEYAGQRWLAGTTVVVEPGVAAPFTAALSELIEGVAIGAAYDTGVALGPVVRPERRDELDELLASEAAAGRVIARHPSVPAGGFYVAAAAARLDGPDSPLWQREIPGPVVSVLQAGRDQAVELVGASRQAAVAAVYGSPEAARAVAGRLSAAIVAVDRAPREPDPRLPSALWGGTFFGASNWGGPDGLRFFTRPQVVQGLP